MRVAVIRRPTAIARWRAFGLGLVSTLIFSPSATHAESAGDSLCTGTVTYLTADLLYLSTGSADGLAVGDSGTVQHGDSVVATIVVSHVASHSASCQVDSVIGTVQIGDTCLVRVSVSHGGPEMSEPTPQSLGARGESPSAQSVVAKPRREPARVNGVLSARVSRFVSDPGISRDYTLTNFGLNLRAHDLWGRDLELTVRTSGRGNYRSSPAGQSRLDNEWSGRISTLSLAYRNNHSGTSIQAGRIPISRLGRLGGVDGLVIEQAVSEPIRLGIFGGFQPRWQYAEDRLATQKAGAYVGWKRGTRQTTLVDVTAGAAGEYHDGTPSREVILLQGRLTTRRWSLNHSAEIDVNRGWRRENSGRAIALSGIYLSGRYRFASWLTGSASYDSRRDYWTYEKRTLADSLFDDNLRQGLRGQADVSLPMRSTLTLGAGYRNRAGDADPTISYTAGVRTSGIGQGRLSLSMLGTGFDGPTENGYDVSAHAGASITRQVFVDLGSGHYAYKSVFTDAQRSNRWIEGSIRSTILSRLVGNLGYRYSTGDDLSGHRVDIGLTRPF